MISVVAMVLVAQADIDKVVVYSDRAEVTRVQGVACAGSAVEAVFGGLPATLLENSFRAEAAGGEVLGLTHRRVTLDPGTDSERATLAAEIQKLDDEAKVLDDERRGIDERSGSVGGFYGYFGRLWSEALRDPKSKADDWKRSLEFFASERLAAAAAQQKNAIATRKLLEAKERLQRRLQMLGGVVETEVYEASVAVACSGGTVKVSLGYLIPGATWRPEYDLRFAPGGAGKTGKGRLTLTVGAVIIQATGEDWKQVQLVLSTARPQLGAKAPLPAPLWIDGHKAEKEKVMVQGQEDRRSLQTGGDGESAPADAVLDDGGPAMTLSLPARATVLADGRPYWMPVDELATEAEAKLVTVPKLTARVFQAVSTKNPAKYPLLPGRLHLYRKGSYIGDSWLERTAPGEPMEVSLGIDAELSVERIDVLAKDRDPGLLSSTKKLERHLQVRIQNRGGSAQKVEVRESLPVSKDKRIEVRFEKAQNSAGYQHDALRGFVTWAAEVPARGKKELDFRYEIRLPDDWQIQ